MCGFESSVVACVGKYITRRVAGLAERVGLIRAILALTLRASPASTSSRAVLPGNRTQVLRTAFFI